MYTSAHSSEALLPRRLVGSQQPGPPSELYPGLDSIVVELLEDFLFLNHLTK